MPQSYNRLSFLDYARGVAIILVVAGHYCPSASPELWVFIKNFIYCFHMPVFFLVSGFLFFRELQKEQPIKFVIRKKLLRLGLPFISIAAFFCAVKLAASVFVNLEHNVSITSFINVFIWPLNSFMTQLWFIQAILLVFIVYSLLYITLKLKHWMIFILSIVLSFVTITDYFSINPALYNFNYFCLGVLIAQFGVHERLKVTHTALGGILLLSLALMIFSLWGNDALAVRLAGYCGLMGLLCLSLFWGSAELRPTHWIKHVGFYSMGIYLFHTLFESSVRVAYYQVFKLPDNYFWFGFIAAVSAGIICSLLFEKYFLRRFALTRKLILGLN